MRIWQCVDGHPVCEGCRDKLDTRCSFVMSGYGGMVWSLTSNLTPGAAPPATDPWRAATSHWVSCVDT